MQIFLMDTIIELQAQGNKAAANAAMKQAIEELHRIDTTFGYQESLLKTLNSSNTVRNRELSRLVDFSLDVHAESSGAFSITLRPILDAWGFSGTHPYRIPGPEEFEYWKNLPGDSGIILHEDGETIKTKDGVQIDLGGVAKGYAADNAANVLQDNGITTGLVNAGGDIVAFGKRTWRIGIKNPRAPGTFATIPLMNKAIATSGDYERFFVVDKKRYCHILDPATGWPAQKYMSASVVADTCAEADAWSTALFVKGPETLGEILMQKGMDWIVISLDGTVSSSASLKKYCPNRITSP